MIRFLTDRILIPGDTDSSSRSRAGKRCGFLGIVLNTLLFAAKMVIAFLSGSVSIAADAANNLSDASSSVVTLVGFKLSERPADERHPFGYARFEYLSGLAVAGMIVVIGVELIQTSVKKIIYPEETVFSAALVAVLLISIGVKLFLAAVNQDLGRRMDSQALLAAAADSRNDCISTGAVLISAIVTHYTGLHIDGYTGLVVALMILWSGISIARQTISPLLGENADPEISRMIVEILRSSDKILGFHDLMVHDYGPGQRFASVHVEMDMKEDPLVCHTIISHVENKVLAKGVHLVVHYDPMVTDDAEQNRMKENVRRVLKSIDARISIHDFRLVREKDRNCLLFDMVLPDELSERKQKIKEMLDTAINLGDTVYSTFITFDTAGSIGEEFHSI